MRNRTCRLLMPLLLPAVVPLVAGCPAVTRTAPKGQVVRSREPVTNQTYRLYVPSAYHAGREWPLVVTAHGTPPFDTSALQMNEWIDIAENRGFIVVAPELKGTRAQRNDSNVVDRQIAQQRADEQAILGAVNHVKGAYRVDEGKVFLTGWSAGAYAVLWTGLGHPEIFRALAVRQGNFDARFLEPITGRFDPHQPVLVFYGQVDPLRGQAESAIEWLKGRGMNVFGDEVVGAHQRMPGMAWRYFESVLKAYPWLVVQWRPGWAGRPLSVRLWARTDPAPQRITWDFGDGTAAEGPSVLHDYAAGGTYDVTVRGYYAGRQPPVERRIQVTVAPAATPPAPATTAAD